MPTMNNMVKNLSGLVEFGQPVSTLQLAKSLGICWSTARSNLEGLFNLGIVEKGRVGNNKRIYWRPTEVLK